MQDEPKKLIHHLKELQSRMLFVVIAFVISFCVCYKNVNFLIEFLTLPLKKYLSKDSSIIYTSLPEVFLGEISISFFFALLIVVPFFLIQLWLFVKTGLYKIEKKVLKRLLFFIPFLFYAGVAFVYFLILPKAIQFFLSFEQQVQLKFLPSFVDYIKLLQKFMLVFGIGFELPVVLWGMVELNLITLQCLKKNWRIVVFVIFTVSAFITPPDAVSMLALAVPLIVLYIITIIMIQCSNKKYNNN